ncbi:hypothetical protein F2P79_022195 [Pimephales promelas]|nr:hypothetical protein F2P79_022195 [Pimephales promelas]
MGGTYSCVAACYRGNGVLRCTSFKTVSTRSIVAAEKELVRRFGLENRQQHGSERHKKARHTSSDGPPFALPSPALRRSFRSLLTLFSTISP